MKNLFIIGNGFDSAHKLPTEYAKFKEYLSNNIKGNLGIKDTSKECIKIEEISCLPSRKIWYGKGICEEYWKEEQLIYWLVDEVSNGKNDMRWSDFETYLSELNVEAVLNKWGYTIDNAMKIQETLTDISGFFFRWINTVDLSVAKKKVSMEKLIRPDKDLVLTFNYTETLEKIYGVCEDNICHIHGKRETNSEEQKRKDMVSIGENYSELIIGYEANLFKKEKYNFLNGDEKVNGAIQIAVAGLIKDTEQNIFREKAFFDAIEKADIQNIYSIGMSYSDVDMPYIREICKRIRKSGSMEKGVWSFEEYDPPERRNIFKKKVTRAGYTGTYSGFRI